MKRIALIAAGLCLGASAASAGMPMNGIALNGIQLSNTAHSGDAAPMVVHSIVLADGTFLTVEPAR